MSLLQCKTCRIEIDDEYIKCGTGEEARHYCSDKCNTIDHLQKQLTEAKEEMERFKTAGWRSCIDHIIKPETSCPVCRAEKAEHNLILQKNVNKTKSRLLKEERQENKRLRDSLESAYDMLDAVCDTPTDRQALKEVE